MRGEFLIELYSDRIIIAQFFHCGSDSRSSRYLSALPGQLVDQTIADIIAPDFVLRSSTAEKDSLKGTSLPTNKCWRINALAPMKVGFVRELGTINLWSGTIGKGVCLSTWSIRSGKISSQTWIILPPITILSGSRPLLILAIPTPR